MWEFGRDNDDLFSLNTKRMLRWMGRRFLEYGVVIVVGMVAFILIGGLVGAVYNFESVQRTIQQRSMAQ